MHWYIYDIPVQYVEISSISFSGSYRHAELKHSEHSSVLQWLRPIYTTLFQLFMKFHMCKNYINLFQRNNICREWYSWWLIEKREVYTHKWVNVDNGMQVNRQTPWSFGWISKGMTFCSILNLGTLHYHVASQKFVFLITTYSGYCLFVIIFVLSGRGTKSNRLMALQWRSSTCSSSDVATSCTLSWPWAPLAMLSAIAYESSHRWSTAVLSTGSR